MDSVKKTMSSPQEKKLFHLYRPLAAKMNEVQSFRIERDRERYRWLDATMGGSGKQARGIAEWGLLLRAILQTTRNISGIYSQENPFCCLQEEFN